MKYNKKATKAETLEVLAYSQSKNFNSRWYKKWRKKLHIECYRYTGPEITSESLNEYEKSIDSLFRKYNQPTAGLHVDVIDLNGARFHLATWYE